MMNHVLFDFLFSFFLFSSIQVETIGDAYMVVGGLPEVNNEHAECVANQSLDMMHYCKQVIRPDTNDPVQVGNSG